MKWSEETRKFFGESLAALVRDFVGRTVYPVATKLDATTEVLNALRERVDSLEARLAEIESPKVRRIA